MKETVIFLQDLFHAHTFERYQKIRCENGHLVVQLPRLNTAQRKISIRCEETKQWRLLEFGCEFEIDTNTRTGG
jgi:hypothetical protein